MVAVSSLTKLPATGTWDAIVIVDKHVNQELGAQFDLHRADDEAFDKEVSYCFFIYFFIFGFLYRIIRGLVYILFIVD